MSANWRQRIGDYTRSAGQSAEEIAHHLIKLKLGEQIAVGAGAAGLIGGTGALVNTMQDDRNGNLLFNPVTQAAVLGTAGAGLGYYGTELYQNHRNGLIQNTPTDDLNLGYEIFDKKAPPQSAPQSGPNAPGRTRNTFADNMRSAANYVDPRRGRYLQQEADQVRQRNQGLRRGRNAIYGAGAASLVGLMQQLADRPSVNELQEY